MSATASRNWEIEKFVDYMYRSSKNFTSKSHFLIVQDSEEYIFNTLVNILNYLSQVRCKFICKLICQN